MQIAADHATPRAPDAPDAASVRPPDNEQPQPDAPPPDAFADARALLRELLAGFADAECVIAQKHPALHVRGLQFKLDMAGLLDEAAELTAEAAPILLPIVLGRIVKAPGAARLIALLLAR